MKSLTQAQGRARRARTASARCRSTPATQRAAAVARHEQKPAAPAEPGRKCSDQGEVQSDAQRDDGETRRERMTGTPPARRRRTRKRRRSSRWPAPADRRKGPSAGSAPPRAAADQSRAREKHVAIAERPAQQLDAPVDPHPSVVGERSAPLASCTQEPHAPSGAAPVWRIGSRSRPGALSLRDRVGRGHLPEQPARPARPRRRPRAPVRACGRAPPRPGLRPGVMRLSSATTRARPPPPAPRPVRGRSACPRRSAGCGLQMHPTGW